MPRVYHTYCHGETHRWQERAALKCANSMTSEGTNKPPEWFLIGFQGQTSVHIERGGILAASHCEVAQDVVGASQG